MYKKIYFCLRIATPNLSENFRGKVTRVAENYAPFHAIFIHNGSLYGTTAYFLQDSYIIERRKTFVINIKSNFIHPKRPYELLCQQSVIGPYFLEKNQGAEKNSLNMNSGIYLSRGRVFGVTVTRVKIIHQLGFLVIFCDVCEVLIAYFLSRYLGILIN